MLRKRFLRLFGWACVSSFLLLLPLVGTFAAGSGYKIVRRIPIGGEGGWDGLAIDADAQRIYITRGAHIMVVDETSGKVVGDLPLSNTKNVHHVELAQDLGKGFTSNGSANTVTIFDLKTVLSH